MNNMWQLHGMQQAEQLNGSFSKHPHRQSSSGGGGGSRHHNAAPYPHPASHVNSRNQRYNDEQGPSGRHGQHGHGRDGYHQHHHQQQQQKERGGGGGRHHDGRGGSRHYDDRSRSYQDNRWNRRYWELCDCEWTEGGKKKDNELHTHTHSDTLRLFIPVFKAQLFRLKTFFLTSEAFLNL